MNYGNNYTKRDGFFTVNFQWQARRNSPDSEVLTGWKGWLAENEIVQLAVAILALALGRNMRKRFLDICASK